MASGSPETFWATPRGDCSKSHEPVLANGIGKDRETVMARWTRRLATGIGISLAWASTAMAADPADIVYRDGRIYTVDKAQPWAEAVAIDDGKFVFVGSDEGVKAYIGPATQVVDLGQRMAMPGLHDAHQHLVKGQNRQIFCQISAEADIVTLIAALQACDKDKRYGGWLVADVYRGDNFPGGFADRKYLDEAFPDTPVYIREWSYHHGLANSKALELAGVTRDTPDPEGGRILRRPDGEPTGELLSKATWLVTQRMPTLPEEVVRDALLRTAALCAQYGITSTQDAASSEAMIAEIQRLDREGKWKMRTAVHLVWGNPASAMMSDEAIRAYLDDRERYRSQHLFTDFVKVYVDGSPLQPHATDVEMDEHGDFDRGRLYESPEVLAAALTHFDAMGVKVKMHAVGSGAIHVALEGIAAMRKVNGASELMPDIAHSLRYAEVDLDRPAMLHAVAEMSPAIWQIKGPLTTNLAGAWPFKSLLARGTLMTLGSDWVVLPAPNLFPAIGGMLDHGAESIGLADALEIATLNGARSVGWDDVTGSIAVGKFANMIVLDRNLFEATPAQIGETRVLRTVFEGETVYEAGKSDVL
jgi:predicted amidohydrolase YtcJ